MQGLPIGPCKKSLLFISCSHGIDGVATRSADSWNIPGTSERWSFLFPFIPLFLLKKVLRMMTSWGLQSQTSFFLHHLNLNGQIDLPVHLLASALRFDLCAIHCQYMILVIFCGVVVFMGLAPGSLTSMLPLCKYFVLCPVWQYVPFILIFLSCS